MTHMVNLLEWITGPTASLFCEADHQVLAGVEVEDTVSIIARSQNGAIISYNLNQFQSPNEVTVQFNCEKGSVKFEYHHNRWGHLAQGAEDWTWATVEPLGRDGPFSIQAHDFIDAIEGKATPLATLEAGIQAVRFNLACFESIRTGSRVTIK